MKSPGIKWPILVAGLVACIAGCDAAPAPTESPTSSSTASSPTPSATVAPVGSTVDVARLSYLDNLIAREQAGEWDVGSGMETTLRALIGATSARQAVWQPALASYDLTGLFATAQDMSEDAPAASREARIGRILRFLTFDREQLMGMVVDPLGPQPTPLKITPPPVLGPDQSHIPDATFDPASRTYDTGCELFFRRFPVGAGAQSCLASRVATAGAYEYTVFSPAPSLASFHWSQEHHDWVDTAVGAASAFYLSLGVLPPLDVVLATNLDAPGEAATIVDDDRCTVLLYTNMQLRDEPAFEQIVARQLAHCFIAANFDSLVGTDFASERWFHDGLATYLSSQAVPEGNVELELLPTLQAIDERVGVDDWSSAAFVWFQFVGNDTGLPA